MRFFEVLNFTLVFVELLSHNIIAEYNEKRQHGRTRWPCSGMLSIASQNDIAIYFMLSSNEVALEYDDLGLP
jgi:hypothetical protein